ncbi:hypothetical protein PQX77_001776 [Marasmius sp. AFHP31]|nr:hypothetical protein PQX77_001776 [Marasmius sp. AFHP31]
MSPSVSSTFVEDTRNEENQKRMPASKSFESVFLPWEEGVAEGFIAVPIAIEHMAEFVKMGLRVVDPKVDAAGRDSKPSHSPSKQVDLPRDYAIDKHGDKLVEVVDRFNREKPILSRRLLSKSQLIYSWPRNFSELEHNVSASTRNEENQKRMPASKSFESVFLPWEEGVAEGFIAVPIAIEHMAEFVKMGLRVVDPKVDAAGRDSKPSHSPSKQVDLPRDCWWADGRCGGTLRPSVSTGSVRGVL